MAREDVRQLSEVTRNTNTVVTQFRQASNDNTKNMSRIVKDLSSVFRNQKSEISSLNNTLDETVNATNKTAVKVDQTNNLIQESINIQNRMLSEFRNLSKRVKEGNDNNTTLLEKIVSFITKTAAVGAGAVAAGTFAKLTSDYDPKNPKLPSDQLPSEAGRNLKYSATEKASEKQKAIIETANKIGISPEDLATVISYETGGTMSPSIMGGTGGNYMGLIQFGPAERKKYGVNQNQSFSEQMKSVEKYLIDRKLKDWLEKNPNASLQEKRTALYSTINAGSPGQQHWNKSDRPGSTVRSHTENMFSGQHFSKAKKFLEGGVKTEEKQKLESNLENYKNELFNLGGGRTGNIENVSNLNSELKSAILGALRDYKEATGKTATITSGFRTKEDQASISSRYMRAKPGTSNHEKGSAIDINSEDARLMDEMGILSKHGLHRPHGERDPVHIELKSGSSKQNERQNERVENPGASRGMGAEPIPSEALRRPSRGMGAEPIPSEAPRRPSRGMGAEPIPSEAPRSPSRGMGAGPIPPEASKSPSRGMGAGPIPPEASKSPSPLGERDPVHIELKSGSSKQNERVENPGASRGMGTEPIPSEALRRPSPFMNIDPRSMMPSFTGMGGTRSEGSPMSILSNVLGNIPQLGPAGSIIGPIASILGNLTSQNMTPPVPYTKDTSAELKPTVDAAPSIGKILENMSKKKDDEQTRTQPSNITTVASTMSDQKSENWHSNVTRYYGVGSDVSRLIA